MILSSCGGTDCATPSRLLPYHFVLGNMTASICNTTLRAGKGHAPESHSNIDTSATALPQRLYSVQGTEPRIGVHLLIRKASGKHMHRAQLTDRTTHDWGVRHITHTNTQEIQRRAQDTIRLRRVAHTRCDAPCLFPPRFPPSRNKEARSCLLGWLETRFLLYKTALGTYRTVVPSLW